MSSDYTAVPKESSCRCESLADEAGFFRNDCKGEVAVSKLAPVSARAESKAISKELDYISTSLIVTLGIYEAATFIFLNQ